MIPIFAGYDGREAVGYHTFCQSVIENASEPVTIAPLDLGLLKKVYKGGQKDGTNAFIYSRFLVPHLMGYQGFAIFVDGSDMLCRGDIAELWAMRDAFCAVQVVQHDYKTKNPVKYIGTPLESKNDDYPRKNWSSVMLINCAHVRWRDVTPEKVAKSPGSYLHRFEFIEDRYVGGLPVTWNWLADEYGQSEQAKLIHWSSGIPAFDHYKNAAHSDEWRKEKDRAFYAQTHYATLSG